MSKQFGLGFGVMILKDNKVLLGKRHDDPEKAGSNLHGEGTWTMPGGKLDFGELFTVGATREVEEETSLKVNTLEFISVTSDAVSDWHYVTLGFLCKDFIGEPKVMEPEEIVEWQWFDIDNLPEPMYFPSERIVKNYKDKKYFQEFE